MSTALVVGKFLPPHAGHAKVIDRAMQLADRVHIFVNDRPSYAIPAEIRVSWVQQSFPAAVVHLAPDPYGDDDSAGQAASIQRILGFTPDVLVTSEDWADPVSEILGSRHERVDPPRAELPISATMLRNDPLGHWSMLLPAAKAGLCHRIVLVGAESTGKTTLAKALAGKWGTTWANEIGRDYSQRKADEGTGDDWGTSDLVEIANMQQEIEDFRALRSGPLMVCDTEALSTGIWHELYMGAPSPEVVAIANRRRYSLFVLTSLDVPWERDGIRTGDHLRPSMHQRFLDELAKRPEPWIEVRGSVEQRVALIEAEIDRLGLRHPDAIFNPRRWS